MKNSLNKFSIVLLVLLFAAAAFASGEVDAVFLEINKTYTLHADGSMRYEYHHRIKLLTFFAVNRIYGETFIVTNPEFQTLTVDQSETTMADGKRVPSPENATNEVLPRSVHNAPDYAHLREMVVTHTALEKGAVIELRYHIDTRAGFLPWFMGEEIFGQRSPVEKMTVTINVPRDAELQYQLFSGAIPFGTEETETGSRFVWRAENLALIPAEAGSPEMGAFAPRLVFSTCPDWTALSGFVSKQLKDATVLPESARDALLSDIDAVNGQARIMAIRDHVSTRLGSVDFDPVLTGFRSADPAVTFKRNYGTVLDKARLLKAILDAEGVASHVGLVSGNRQFSAVVPSLAQFGSACVFAEPEEGTVMVLTPEGSQKKQGQYALAGRVLFSPGEEQPLMMKVDETGSENNALKIKADLTLDADLKLTGRAQVQTGGFFHEGYALFSSEKQSGFAARLLKAVLGDGVVTSVSTLSQNANGGLYAADFSAEDLFEKIGETDLYRYGGLRSLFDLWHVPVAGLTRKTPLELPSAMTEHLEITIALPEEFAVLSHPDDFNMTRDSGHLMGRWRVEDNRLVIERQWVISQRDVDPEAYPGFRELVVNLEAADNRTFVIGRR